MANAIKHNVSTKTTNCCIRKNNFDIGVVESYPYGPTSSTDFWAGYAIPSGGFVTYQNKASQGPSIYAIPSVNDLVSYGKNLNIGTVTGPAYVIRTCSALNDIILVNIDYTEIPLINNNILTLDAGYTPSYGWGGAEWYDVAGGSVTQGTLTGGTTFITGSSATNYSDSYLNMPAGTQTSMALVPTFGSALQNFTINIWINLTSGNGYLKNQNVVGQQYATAGGTQTNCNFLIRGNGTNGFEAVIRLAGVDYVADFGSIGTGWRNLTFTYDGNQLQTYLGGNPQNSAAGPGATLVSNGLQTIIGGTTNAIANNGNVQNYFDGGVSIVQIFNTALSEGEVQGLNSPIVAQRGY